MSAVVDRENLSKRLWEFAPQAKALLLEMIACPSISGDETDVLALLDQNWKAAGFHWKVIDSSGLITD